jgi:hypothetical protein
MKKVIRLTESDLTRIVKRVISEENEKLDDKKVQFRFLLNNIKPLVSSVFDKTYIREIDGKDKIKTMSMALLDNTTKKLVDPTINITNSNLDDDDFYYRVFGGSKRKEEIDMLRAGGRGPKEALFVNRGTFMAMFRLITLLKDGVFFSKSINGSNLVKELDDITKAIKNVKYTDYKSGFRNYRETPNSKDVDIIRRDSDKGKMDENRFFDTIRDTGKRIKSKFGGMEQKILDKIYEKYGVDVTNYEFDYEGNEIRVNDLDSPEQMTFYIYDTEDGSLRIESYD